jgi:hypothetical protein
VRVNGRTYGLQPKFLRMRELHGLLYYLIYGYAGQPHLDQAQALGTHRSQPSLERNNVYFTWAVVPRGPGRASLGNIRSGMSRSHQYRIRPHSHLAAWSIWFALNLAL